MSDTHGKHYVLVPFNWNNTDLVWSCKLCEGKVASKFQDRIRFVRHKDTCPQKEDYRDPRTDPDPKVY